MRTGRGSRKSIGWAKKIRGGFLRRDLSGNVLERAPRGWPVVLLCQGAAALKSGQDRRPSLTEIRKLVIFPCSSESGGIGRRTGLRNQRLRYGGSTPPSRTIWQTALGQWPGHRQISHPCCGERNPKRVLHGMTVLLKMFETRKVLHADQC